MSRKRARRTLVDGLDRRLARCPLLAPWRLFHLGALLSTMLAVQRYNGLAYVSGERQRAASMKSNGEKPSYALDPLIVRGWELKANGIRLEELLAAYAQLQGGDHASPGVVHRHQHDDRYRLYLRPAPQCLGRAALRWHVEARVRPRRGHHRGLRRRA